jgi:hypothetical protein
MPWVNKLKEKAEAAAAMPPEDGAATAPGTVEQPPHTEPAAAPAVAVPSSGSATERAFSEPFSERTELGRRFDVPITLSCPPTWLVCPICGSQMRLDLTCSVDGFRVPKAPDAEP